MTNYQIQYSIFSRLSKSIFILVISSNDNIFFSKAIGTLKPSGVRLLAYSRLAAADTDGLQAGALHASVVHPGFPQWVVLPLKHTQRWNEWHTSMFLSHHFWSPGWILELWVSPLESKWHTMGAAEPPLAHRRNPAAASTKWTPASSIFIWSPLSLCCLIYTHWGFLRVRRGGGVNAVMWPTGLADNGISDAIRWGMERWRFVGGKEEGILYLGTVLGTLEITSLRFGEREPLMKETMTHPVQWLRVGGEAGRCLCGRYLTSSKHPCRSRTPSMVRATQWHQDNKWCHTTKTSQELPEDSQYLSYKDQAVIDIRI